MMTQIRCPVREAAQISRDEPAFLDEDGKLTFGEFEQRVDGAAAYLAAAGVGEGDHVGVWMPRHWRTAAVVMALMRRGGVACLLSRRLPGPALRSALHAAGCVALLTDDGSAPTACDVPVWPAAHMVTTPVAPVRGRDTRTLSLQQPATLIWTSGTGGHPKAVLHTAGNHYYSALGSNRNLRVRSGDRWLLSLPLYHVGGLGILWRCLLAGAAVAIPPEELPLPDAVARYRPTHLSLVPTQLLRLLRERETWQPDRDPRAILLGGAPASEALLARAARAGWPVHCSYGLTEMCSQVATAAVPLTPESHPDCGTVLRHRELQLGADGEILVRGQTRFAGYWTPDGGLETPFDAQGWFATGDLGDLDGEGRLRVLGRKDNQFISGGENIHPEEIERALCAMAGVEEAVVVPVDHAEYGRRPVAFVRTRAGAGGLDQLPHLLAGVLPRFKIPDAFYPWPDAEMPPDAKPDRQMLKRIARRSGGQ
jgi:o-succinylbenzoate---CoA ligase